MQRLQKAIAQLLRGFLRSALGVVPPDAGNEDASLPEQVEEGGGFNHERRVRSGEKKAVRVVAMSSV